MSLPLKTFSQNTNAKAEDVQSNFDELLILNAYNELPSGLINGSNIDFSTAFKFKATTLRIYLTVPPAVGAARLVRNVNYTETLDLDGNGTGFQMLTPIPDTPQILIIDYQRANSS